MPYRRADLRLLHFAWRVLLVLAVFGGVGLLMSHRLIARAVARGTPEYSVRLAGEMGGLFVGGAAAVLTGLLLLLRKRGPRSEDH